MTPRVRRNLLRILPFPLIWVVLAQVFLVSDYAATGGQQALAESAITVDFGVWLFATLAVAVAGTLVGGFDLFVLRHRFERLGLAVAVLVRTLFFGAILGVVVLIAFPVAAALEMGTALTDPRVVDRLRGFLWSPTAAATGVQLGTSLLVSLFYSEISEHMGPRRLRDFVTGRYHTPREERRIFLFSDMKSSTTITERLGHVAYFEFLRAYYRAFSDAIVDHGGEVYQYVGDEIVVSWREAVGLADAACIRCVLAMKRDLDARAAEFEARFGVRPEFRAALQTGDTTTGQIGALRKEIVFTGDVLNQTARIQALCGRLGHDLLVGDDLKERLTGVGGEGEGWRLRSLGTHELRGKDARVEVFALEEQLPGD